MQAEVAKRIVTAEDLQKRKAGQGGQGKSSPDKRLRTEEVADRRGTSAKRSLSEEVAEQRKGAYSSICPPTYPFIHPFVLPFADSLIHSFVASMIYYVFFGSLIHCFVDSLLHCKLYQDIH